MIHFCDTLEAAVGGLGIFHLFINLHKNTAQFGGT
jgi:hypothetical protein